MSNTIGDRVPQRLSEWGVRRIFGDPGDGINGLMGAMAAPPLPQHTSWAQAKAFMTALARTIPMKGV